jgi:hypothetical protein
LCIGLVSFLRLTPDVYAQIESISDATPSATPVIVPPESAINLTLSPISIQLEVEPGGSETAAIKLRNNGSEDEPLKVSYGTFTFNERTQQIDLTQDVPADTASWISVDRPQFIVKPGEWETVNVTFAPPAQASLTYYYAVIFSRIDQVVPGDSTTKVTGAPAVLVLTNVDSPLTKRELQVESFSVPKFWVEFLPQTFSLKVRNTGNVHLAPSGNVFIDGPRTKDLAVLSANPKNSIILPDSMRELTISWDDGFPKWVPSDSTVEQELKWDFSQADRLRIGKYTAHLLLVYDNGEREIPIESYVSFWVIPWRISLAVIAIAVFFLLGIRSSLVSLYRSIRHKKDRL